MAQAISSSLFVKRPDEFGRFVVISLIAHVAAVIAIVAVNFFFNASPRLDLDQKPIHATLVRLGKPREDKLLPRIEETPPPAKKAEGVDPVAVKPPPQKPSLLAAFDAAKTQKQPGAHDGADRRKQLFGAFNKVSKSAQEAEGQADGDPNGDAATQEGDRYLALLQSLIHRNYDVSQTISEQERLHLRATVVLFIGKGGEVLRLELVRPSGNGLFDRAVMAAVKKASPFAPPPDNLRSALQRTGQPLEFRP